MFILKFNKKEIINLPNWISFFRLVLSFFMYYFISNGLKTAIIITTLFAFFSDYLDGYVARRYNIITEFGKILDPLADKVFIGLSVVAMFFASYISPIFFWSIISRDILIFLGGIYLTSKISYVVPSDFLGKLTVNILSLTLLLRVLDITAFDLTLEITSLIFILLSFLKYFFRFIVLLKTYKN